MPTTITKDLLDEVAAKLGPHTVGNHSSPHNAQANPWKTADNAEREFYNPLHEKLREKAEVTGPQPILAMKLIYVGEAIERET